MLTIVKLAAAAAAIPVAAIEITGPVGLAAMVAAVIYLARTARAGSKYFIGLGQIALHGWEKLEHLPSPEQFERITDFAETSEGRLTNLEQGTAELRKTTSELKDTTAALEVHAAENGEALKALTRELDVPVRQSDRRTGDRRRRPRPAT